MTGRASSRGRGRRPPCPIRSRPRRHTWARRAASTRARPGRGRRPARDARTDRRAKPAPLVKNLIRAVKERTQRTRWVDAGRRDAGVLDRSGPRYPGIPPADVAQLVEHFTRNEGVPGSNPGVGFKERPGKRPLSFPARSASKPTRQHFHQHRSQDPLPLRGSRPKSSAERRASAHSVSTCRPPCSATDRSSSQGSAWRRFAA